MPPRPLSVVTGANSGFGYGAAELLLARGHDVIMACRNEALASVAAAKLSAVAASAGAPARGTAIVMALDLASLASVCAFAAAFTAAHGDRQLVFLVNKCRHCAVWRACCERVDGVRANDFSEPYCACGPL